MKLPQWLCFLVGPPLRLRKAVRRGVGAFWSRKLSDEHHVVVQHSPQWREPVRRRLDELCGLPRGWNGYHADPVDRRIAAFALGLLEQTCGRDTPIPSIVPGADGDLQIEWHLHQADIELHVRAPNDVHAWRESPQTADGGEELMLARDFSSLRLWMKTLTEPERAAALAAP